MEEEMNINAFKAPFRILLFTALLFQIGPAVSAQSMILVDGRAAPASNLAATGSISGVVTAQAGGVTIEGVEICRWDYDTGENFTCTTTLEDGTYSFTGLAAGNYRLRAHSPGWSWQFYSGTTQWDD